MDSLSQKLNQRYRTGVDTTRLTKILFHKIKCPELNRNPKQEVSFHQRYKCFFCSVYCLLYREILNKTSNRIENWIV